MSTCALTLVDVTRARLLALHKRYLAGESAKDLAHEAEISYGGLMWHFRKADLRRFTPAEKNTIPLDDPRAQELFRRWDAGEGMKPVANDLHLGTDTARRLLIVSGRNPQAGRFGERHPGWKGGRIEHGNGYIMVRVDPTGPFADMLPSSAPYVMEHRLVMAQHLGRSLTRGETVHHKNGKRDDNRLENLQLRVTDHGQGAAWRCADCGSRQLEPVPLN